MPILLKKTKDLENEIDVYLDHVIQGGEKFKNGIKFYLLKQMELFEEKLEEIDKCEANADSLRRTIETKLYSQTLIPEHRGDVLGILESTDKVLNLTNEILYKFSVETPDIGQEFETLFTELAETAVESIEFLVCAIRAYFRDAERVRDYITKVIECEKGADKISDKLKRGIFQKKDLDLATKIHLGHFAFHIENIADAAEDVCDRLSIASIKKYV